MNLQFNLTCCNSAHNTAEKNNNHISFNHSKSFSKIAALALVSSIALSGCTMTNTESVINGEDTIVTGSINDQVRNEGLDETDTEQIKNTVVHNVPSPQSQSNDSNLLAWNNPETGNKGTITAIDDYIGTHGQSCKKFRTTVDSFMGIALYNGETCELKKGFWVISWLVRDKAE